jgi:three-Cys-motif partner protein
VSRDPEPTVWQAEPHTRAKHELLRRYLGGWFPIMTRHRTKVIYLDGYCGPGRYESSEPGSPVIALNTLLDHSYRQNMTAKQFLFLFNDDDQARIDELQRVLEAERQRRGGAWPPYVVEPQVSCASFESTAQDLIDRSKAAGRRLAPVFAFVDPFGWKGLPITTLRDLLQDPGCELFVLFSYNAIQRWTTHEGTRHSLTELFGTEEFAKAPRGSGRKAYLRDLYARQLKTVCRFPYVLDFEMVDSKNRTSYFLFYATRHLKGLELMKEAMWKVDPVDGCLFSDLTADLTPLFDGATLHAEDLQHLISTRFAGQSVRYKPIKEYVLVHTPYPPSMIKKYALKPLQSSSVILCTGQSKAGTFPDQVEISFPAMARL